MPEDYKRVLTVMDEAAAVGPVRGRDAAARDGVARMGETTGFLKWQRDHARSAARSRCGCTTGTRSTSRSTRDTLKQQAGRCMDCGIPFCNNGCPLGNLIPDWNDLVYRDHWREAIERLHATNNFPEFTGRLCPAPCEASCVLGINQDPVTIKQVEVEIVDRAWAEGWIQPVMPSVRTGKRVAVVGSGPAGLAAAQQLTRAGHDVVVFERDDRIGGLLRYGIPEFKMEKRHLDRRLDQMRAEGTEFRANANVGVNVAGVRAARVRRDGARRRRDGGARPADPRARATAASTRRWSTCRSATTCSRATSPEPTITAAGKRVVIIGGGDTGADCLGTAHRQGAASVHQFEILPRPPDEPRADEPVADMVRTSSACRPRTRKAASASTASTPSASSATTRATCGRCVAHEVEMVDGRFEKIEGTRLRAAVRARAARDGLRRARARRDCSSSSASSSTRAATSRATASFMTSVPGVFACGDMGRGQSLIVWAIAEGRACAAGVDRYLAGETQLPSPIEPTARQLL